MVVFAGAGDAVVAVADAAIGVSGPVSEARDLFGVDLLPATGRADAPVPFDFGFGLSGRFGVNSRFAPLPLPLPLLPAEAVGLPTIGFDRGVDRANDITHYTCHTRTRGMQTSQIGKPFVFEESNNKIKTLKERKWQVK